jgi:hypothetical protein
MTAYELILNSHATETPQVDRRPTLHLHLMPTATIASTNLSVHRHRAGRRHETVGGGAPVSLSRRRRRADQEKSAAAALKNCRRRRRSAAWPFTDVG